MPRKMLDFEVHEVSGVTDMAQPLATAVLVKSKSKIPVDKPLAAGNNTGDMADVEKTEQQDSTVSESVVVVETSAEVEKAAPPVLEDPVIYKSAAGREYRASQAEAAELAKQLDEQARLISEQNRVMKRALFAKRAETELAKYPGTLDVHAAILEAIESIADESVRKAALEALHAGNAALGKGFERAGVVAKAELPAADSAESKLNALAKARAEKTGEHFAKAYDAVLQTPEGRALLAQHSSEKREQVRPGR